MKQSMTALHLGGADGLRAIACISVILHHLAQRLMLPVQPAGVQDLQQFMLVGNTGVSLFFVLSGFLLSFPFWRNYLDGLSSPNLKHYMFRRAARIVPGYYLVFMVCTLLVLVLNIPSQYFLLRTITGLTFTAGFHYTTFFPNELNGPFWSISFEVFCYALMPLFMLLMYKLLKKRSFISSFVFWIGALLLILVVNQLIHMFLTPSEQMRGWQFGMIGGAKFWMPNYNPVGFFAHFAFGILAAAVAAKLRLPSTRVDVWKKKGLFDVIGGSALLLVVLFLWFARQLPEFGGSLQNQPFFYPIYPLLMAIPLAIGSHTLILQKLLDNRFFKFTAKISFGLYLWHYLIMTLLSYYFVKDFVYFGISDIGRWAVISVGVVVASYIIATLSYYVVEKPVMDWASKKKPSHNEHSSSMIAS